MRVSSTKFRMDAFNVFNHINAGNPNNTRYLRATTLPQSTAERRVLTSPA